MKFMKLGSKPDLFQSNGENMRYVATDLATDMIVNVGDVKFYLHKFPLLSKSGLFQKLVAVLDDENTKELEIHDIPGGPAAFEICAKFSYGMTVTLNPYNVISARCAAEYLEMYETIDKGNLVYKIEVFLNSSIFKTWKDLIIVFQTTKSLLPWSEELKVVSHCLDSIASKVSIDTSKVEWSYTYNRKNTGNGSPIYEKLKVPKDWWVEDLCDLSSDLYKRVIITIKTKGKVGLDVLGESLNAYTQKRLPWLGKEHGKKGGDDVKTRSFIETIIGLLPDEKQNICCGFLINLLHACALLDGPETRKKELLRRIGLQLQNASVNDIVILDVDLVQELVAIFMMRGRSVENEFLEVKGVDLTAKVNVAKIIDGYLAEIAKDSSVTLVKFADLADMVSSLPRSNHDGIYRAIDMYLKEHPGISKSEKKRICRLMDCRKLSPEACRHAVQNEQLPLRVVVQVLFFEQIRAAATGGSTGGTLTDPVGTLPPGRSRGSSRTGTTNTEEEWGSVPTSEELKALEKDSGKTSKGKGVVMSKRIFMKVFSGKDRDSENGSSDTEETKSTSPAERSRRQSLS